MDFHVSFCLKSVGNWRSVTKERRRLKERNTSGQLPSLFLWLDVRSFSSQGQETGNLIAGSPPSAAIAIVVLRVCYACLCYT